MMKKQVIEKERMIAAFNYFKKIPMKRIGIDFEKALEIALDYKIYSYDSCYLEAALRLNIPLLTFDNKMIEVAKMLGIDILGGKNVGI
jgi:predicted nucleic acid-binding protein